MNDDSNKKRLERFGDTGETWRDTYKPGKSDGRLSHIPIKPKEDSKLE